jgi:hypothetical protein
MSVSIQQILDRAMELASSVGTDSHDSPIVDNAPTAEVLFPTALRRAATEIARSDRNEADILKRTYALTLVNGSITLPTSVIAECLDSSSIYSDDDSDIGQLSSYKPRYYDFLHPALEQLGYYTVRGANLEFREPDEESGEFDGALNLVAVGMPDIPSTLTASMTISDRVAEKTIENLAAMLRGEKAA